MANYITATEADAIVANLIPSTDPDRQAWETLDESDKEIHITRAMVKIDTMPFTGRAAADYQETSFPRRGQTAVPLAVKQALALEACALAAYGGEADQRFRIMSQGVKAFRAGNLSESYTGAVNPMALLSGVARYLLAPYLAGGVDCV
jgi:hypothetical protein